MSGEPWLAKEGWAERRIKDETARMAGCFFGFALVWTLISGGIAITVIGRSSDWGDGVFALIFPGIGLLLLCVGIYMMLHRRRFGIPVFELATLPAVPGEALAGLVRTTGTIDPEGGFNLRLVCLRLTETGSGKNRRTNEETLWEHEEVMPGATRRDDGIAIPVAVPLPADVPETDETNSKNKVVWRLEVGAVVPGVDFRGEFEVPVFRVAPRIPSAER